MILLMLFYAHIVQYTKMNKDIIDISFTDYNPSQLPIPVNLYTYSYTLSLSPFHLTLIKYNKRYIL